MGKLGKVISRLNHPVYLTYKNQGLVLPPRGVLKNMDKSQLTFPLPKGVIFV